MSSSPRDWGHPPYRPTSSYKITATYPRRLNRQQGRVEDFVRQYDLTAEDLRKWLEQKFVGHDFSASISLRADNWYMQVPRKLTELEKAHIDEYVRKEAPQPPEPND